MSARRGHKNAGGTVLDVHVIPRAPVSTFAGTRDGALLVRLKAPPVDGAANEALIELLARRLDLPTRAITIVSGLRSRRKQVRIEDIDEETLRSKLARREP